MSDKKIRYGVVGAGWIAQAVFMPGVEASGNSELTALVTGDAEKARVLGDMYKLKKTFAYEEYDALLRSGLVDAVYISTPNNDHASYAVRALDAGIHVLLEKPAEVTVERTHEIVAAVERARPRGTKLMVAYRMHFEPATLDALERVRKGELGPLTMFASQFTQHVSPKNHRAKQGFDAGPVPDMGPYPINAARMFFDEEPVEIFAKGVRHAELGFSDFDDTVAVTMTFPSRRIAQFTVSYAASGFAAYQLVGEKGTLQMSPAYTFQAGLEQTIAVEPDGKPKHHAFSAVDQFAGETRYFSDCILRDLEPEADIEEGLIDVTIIEAIKQSLASGETQRLPAMKRKRRVDPGQVQKVSSRKQPKLVNAFAPGEG